jgi:hypothetical protein
MTNGITPEERQALLVEYQVCEEDNAANFQGFWTLAAIFLGLSSAFLAGFIYAVIANESLFSILLCRNDPSKTLLIGIIAIIIGVANVVILKKLKGWRKRIAFNQGEINRRMREIELQLGMMQRGWRIYAIDRWYNDKNLRDKKYTGVSEDVWKNLKPELQKDIIDSKTADRLDALLKDDLVRLIQRYFPKGRARDRDKYETWSSGKHFPCILYTLMSLWVVVIAAAVFSIIFAYTCWQLGLIAGVIIVGYIIYLIVDIKKLNKA